MKIEFDSDDFAPLVERIVAETLRQQTDDSAKLNGQLAYNEAEAAAVLGINRHALRDARLRGEVVGTRLGKKVCYERAELTRFLERNRL